VLNDTLLDITQKLAKVGGWAVSYIEPKSAYLRPAVYDIPEYDADVRIMLDDVILCLEPAYREKVMIGALQDITQKKLAEKQLHKLVDHDHLTGLLNRRGLENAVRRATDEVSEGVACAIAHIDVDRFKLFNDLHGFGTGDMLLQQVAQRITTVSRARDNVARVGDSFVVVLLDCSETAAASAMERIREAIAAERFDIDGKALNITVSIGVVALDRSMEYADVTAAAGAS
jgi:diguanylate cyclase (GGDEF)-like protein